MIGRAKALFDVGHRYGDGDLTLGTGRVLFCVF